jgi:predicted nucleic acid-binding protein
MPTEPDTEPPADLLLDTSTAVALVLEDHARHRVVLDAVRGRRLGLAGHAWFETFSVLTRLPPGLRRTPREAARLLRHNFPSTVFLDPRDSAALGEELARLGIGGGAVYDALVGAAARRAGTRLLTADDRALSIYEALGIAVERVG